MVRFIAIIGWIVAAVAVVGLALAVLDLESFLTVKQAVLALVVGLAVALGVPAIAGKPTSV